MAVIVYTTPTCPYCTMAKQYLNQKGVAFIEKDVTRDAVAAQELARMGERGVPVIDVNGQKVVGFNKPLLEQLLAQRPSTSSGRGGAASSGRPSTGSGRSATGEGHPQPQPRKLGAAIADVAGHAPEGSPQGAFVGGVRPGSPAAQGGLQAGDIITTLAGQPIHSAADAERLLARVPAHARIPVQVIRQWQPVEIVVEL